MPEAEKPALTPADLGWQATQEKGGAVVAPPTPAAPEAEEVYDGPVGDEEIDAPAAPATPAAETAAAKTEEPTATAGTATPTTAPAAPAEPATPSTPAPATPGRFEPSDALTKLQADAKTLRAEIDKKLADGTYDQLSDAALITRLQLLKEDIREQAQAEKEAHAEAITAKQQTEERWATFEKEHPGVTRDKAKAMFAEDLAAMKTKYGKDYSEEAITLAAKQRWEHRLSSMNKTAAPVANAKTEAKPAQPANPAFMPRSTGRPGAVDVDPLDEYAKLAPDNDQLVEALDANS